MKVLEVKVVEVKVVKVVCGVCRGCVCGGIRDGV